MERKERIDLKLYGAITEILPDGEFSVCEPVFCNCRDLKDKNLYRLITEKVKVGKDITYFYPKSLDKIDIAQFGTPVFLPASPTKIGDGKKYLIIFQSSKNATKGEERTYTDVPIIRMLDSDYFTRRDYLPTNITVGIKFIVVKTRGKIYSKEILEKCVR